MREHDRPDGRGLLPAGPEGAAWIDAARAASDATSDLQIDTWRIARELTDPACHFLRAWASAPTGALLMRPDGFVTDRLSATRHPESAHLKRLGPPHYAVFPEGARTVRTCSTPRHRSRLTPGQRKDAQT